MSKSPAESLKHFSESSVSTACRSRVDDSLANFLQSSLSLPRYAELARRGAI